LTCSELTTVSCFMTSSILILTAKFVFNGYRIAASPEKVTSREIEFGLSRDGLCAQPTESGRINRSVDAAALMAVPPLPLNPAIPASPIQGQQIGQFAPLGQRLFGVYPVAPLAGLTNLSRCYFPATNPRTAAPPCESDHVNFHLAISPPHDEVGGVAVPFSLGVNE